MVVAQCDRMIKNHITGGSKMVWGVGWWIILFSNRIYRCSPCVPPPCFTVNWGLRGNIDQTMKQYFFNYIYMIDDNKDKEEDNKQGLDKTDSNIVADMNDLWCVPCGMVVINKTKQNNKTIFFNYDR
jgi:hypothetical protein